MSIIIKGISLKMKKRGGYHERNKGTSERITLINGR